MTDPAAQPALGPRSSARVASASILVVTIVVALAAIGVLLSLDLFLAGIDRRESDAHAASEYREGVALLREGRAPNAVEHFGAAVAIDRSNLNYALALGDAMLEAGRTQDAEATLRGLLERAENDGAVNLTMAHVMIREGRTEEAKAYLHRAIFGRWGGDSVARRAQARFDLIDLLARRGAARELLAEILPLEDTSPDSVALRRQLGQWFLLAGSPARAATVFRDLLRRDPEDADAYAGMGRAALALGNFRTGRTNLAEASRLRPNDGRIGADLAVADSVVDLDPTARGLGAHERYTRSRALLARTIATLGRCAPAAPSAPADSALAMLSAVPAAGREEAAGEAMVSMAIDLWAARAASCAPAAHDDVLRLVQNHLAQ